MQFFKINRFIVLSFIVLSFIAFAINFTYFRSISRAETPVNNKTVVHYVAFKFKDGTSAQHIAEITQAFKNLLHKVPNVLSIDNGVNVSPEQLNKGMTNAFVVTFPSLKDRDVYLTHPAHEKFKSFALPYVADAFVFDFVSDAPKLKAEFSQQK